MVSRSILNGITFNQTIGIGDVYGIMPSIAQGTGVSERVGRQIRTRYMYVNLMLTCNPDGLNSNNPILYRIFILNWKGAKQESRLANVPIGNLLACNDDHGAATNLPYNGYPDAHMMPVNTDSFTVLKDIRGRFYPQDNLSQSVSADAHTIPLPQIVKQIRVRIKLPKSLLFDYQSTLNDYPTNFAPFISCGWCYANGIALPSGSTKLMVTARSYLYFEDP